MTKSAKIVAKDVSGLVLGMIVAPLYKPFVVQNFWNWFLVEALHAANISYFQALGITMGFYLLTMRISFRYQELGRWKTLVEAVDACVPDAKKTALEETKEKREKKDPSGLLESCMALGIDTVVLVVGWLIHTFLL